MNIFMDGYILNNAWYTYKHHLLNLWMLDNNKGSIPTTMDYREALSPLVQNAGFSKHETPVASMNGASVHFPRLVVATHCQDTGTSPMPWQVSAVGC